MLIHHLPPSPHNRFLEIAHALALSSPGVGGKNQNRFRLGAIIINNHNHILAAKFNLMKTHHCGRRPQAVPATRNATQRNPKEI